MNNFDLFEYAERHDIEIEYADLPKNKALAIKLGQTEIIGLDKAVAADSSEERTLLAHEIGHCATGCFYDLSANRIDRSRQEHRAIRWALCRCVPKRKLIELIRARYSNNEIADIFGVTEEFIKKAYTYYFEYGIAG